VRIGTHCDGPRRSSNDLNVAEQVDPLLARRLREVGLDPAASGDPGEAWKRLHTRFGRRVTLIDRYALEARHRGITPVDLEPEVRARLTLEVLEAHSPGFEFVAAGARSIADPIELTEYRAAWPRRFSVWRRRISRALGERAVRIDHIGSTAIPGLPAKPVVDIQVSVHDVDDETSYVAAVESTGVALRSREVGHRYFRPAADRPRTVQVHVCAAGSDSEREHLLFRDYLRAHPDAATAYARLKRALATRYRRDRIAYNEGKTGFILDAMDSAREWAARTGWSVLAG
jgi:GrpB-like predicted nucleotidyltransferase (UPF0157 family)